MALADERREYRRGALSREELSSDPIAQFRQWYDQAGRGSGGRWRRFAIGIYKAFQQLLGSPSIEANAMVVATVDGDGHPSGRTVLLKGVDERGFTFFTNYTSRKGRELDANPNAAMVFYWPHLERQVCVAGPVSKLSREESESYFHSRPRGSQVAAAASDQSGPIESREELQRMFREVEDLHRGKPVPIPESWGGYVLKPERIEFWQGRASRLHDRFQFTRTTDGAWQIQRLNP